MAAEWALGLMTGTVLDGMIDIALIRTDGESVSEFGPWALVPYADEIRPLLSEALRQARQWQFEGPEPGIFADAENAITRGQASAVRTFLAGHGVLPRDVAVIGFHGQTVLHRPPAGGVHGSTRQLGDGALLASLTGIDVVSDFRSADMAAGGHGAPLSAIYHQALLRSRPDLTTVLNLGGVANLTWCGPAGCGPAGCGPAGELIAFDVGPANAPINDWVEASAGLMMDRDGYLARQGVVDEARLSQCLEHPFFGEPYPKSLDRFAFTAALAEGLSLQDGTALLTALPAAALGRGLDLLPQRPTRVIVCGGGRKNPVLMDELRARARVDVTLAQDVGWRGDAIEAECFAYLAARRLRDLPSSFASTTGARHAVVGGRVSRKSVSSAA